MDWNDKRKCEKSKNLFEKVKMADVEVVEGSGNIDNLLAGLGAFAVGKLEGDSRFSVITISEKCRIEQDVKTWRSFCVVGRNCETPVQGERADESELI